MAASCKRLTPDEINKLKQLLADAKSAGKCLTELQRENPTYSYKSLKYWNRIFNSNPSYTPQIDQTQIKSSKIKELLIAARDKNQNLSDILRANPDLTMSNLVYWNSVFKVLPIIQKKSYSKEKKIEVLTYAAKHGVMEASRFYDVNDVLITEWNKVFNVFSSKQNSSAIPMEKRIKILTEVKEYNQKHPYSSGVSEIAQKHNVNHRSIYSWNKELKIFDSLFQMQMPHISIEEKTHIIAQSELYPTISELARAVGRSKKTVKNIITSHIKNCNDNIR